MAPITVKLSIRAAWWVRWYLGWVAVAARLTGAPANMVKVERGIRRGLSAQLSSRP
jgi:hypothetical protein